MESLFYKYFRLSVVIVLILFMIGCGTNQLGKQQPEKTANNQSQINDILDNTAKIKVILNKDIVNSHENLIFEISDIKLVRDIITIIKNSTPFLIDSANKIDVSLKKENRLVFTSGNGKEKELIFSFSNLYEYGYIEIGDKKVDPTYDFFRYLQDFKEYRKCDTSIDNNVEGLFEEYNWSVDYKINSFHERLPSNLQQAGGEFPVKLFWAYIMNYLKK